MIYLIITILAATFLIIKNLKPEWLPEWLTKDDFGKQVKNIKLDDMSAINIAGYRLKRAGKFIIATIVLQIIGGIYIGLMIGLVRGGAVPALVVGVILGVASLILIILAALDLIDAGKNLMNNN